MRIALPSIFVYNYAMLEKYDLGFIRKVLIPLKEYIPCPDIGDRTWWNGLPQKTRSEIAAAGEIHIEYQWPLLPAVRYMDFRLNGNRSRFERLYFQRRDILWQLVTAECVEHKGRFLNQIINGIWAVCEETSWCLPAHNRPRRGTFSLPDHREPLIDLFSADTASLLAYIRHILKKPLDEICPLITERIEHEIDTRVLTPFHERNDFRWMGFNLAAGDRINNWNPWINSNILASVLIIEKDNQRRNLGVSKVLASLDNFLQPYSSDGGCDEGPVYWSKAGGSLFDCLELLLAATSGRLNIYSNDLIGEIGRYIYRVFIDQDYFVNFADASARTIPSWSLLVLYGKKIGDKKLERLGRYFKRKLQHEIDPSRRLYSDHTPFRWFRNYMADVAEPGADEIDERGAEEPQPPPYEKSFYFPQLQVATARTAEGAPDGFFLAVKGGHNDESHNHNDVGQFICYYDGNPLIIDVGVETYERKTFSNERYTIWTMQSAYHNLPTVNGFMQEAGRSRRATELDYCDDGDTMSVTQNIRDAYPPESRLTFFYRKVVFTRSRGTITVNDTFRLTEVSEPLKWSFLLATRPSVEGSRLKLASGCLLTIPEDLSVLIETITINDSKLQECWGTELFRAVIEEKKLRKEGSSLFQISSPEAREIPQSGR